MQCVFNITLVMHCYSICTDVYVVKVTVLPSVSSTLPELMLIVHFICIRDSEVLLAYSMLVAVDIVSLLLHPYVRTELNI